MQHQKVFISHSHTCSSDQDQLSKELKPHWPHVNMTSTSPPLTQSSKDAPHTLNHTAPSSLFSQLGLGDTRAWSFSVWYSQLNHHKRDSHITRSKISYSVIEPQLLPLHQPMTMNSMHLHSMHIPLLQHLWSNLHLKSDQSSVGEFFGTNSQRV